MQNKGHLALVWFLISSAHCALFHSLILLKLQAHARSEFQRIERAIPEAPQYSEQVPPSVTVDSTLLSRGTFLLSLPLLPFMYKPRPDNAAYFELEIPIEMRFLNSAIVGGLLHLIALGLVQRLSEKNHWRAFIEGKGFKTEGDIPAVVERMPFMRAARFFKSFEKGGLHRVKVIAGAHLIATIIVHWLEIGERMGGTKGIWSTAGQLLHFPVTPLLVARDFMTMHDATDGKLMFLVMIANSALAALLGAIVIQIFINVFRSNDGGMKPS